MFGDSNPLATLAFKHSPSIREVYTLAGRFLRDSDQGFDREAIAPGLTELKGMSSIFAKDLPELYVTLYKANTQYSHLSLSLQQNSSVVERWDSDAFQYTFNRIIPFAAFQLTMTLVGSWYFKTAMAFVILFTFSELVVVK